jgi:hypothetical protein
LRVGVGAEDEIAPGRADVRVGQRFAVDGYGAGEERRCLRERERRAGEQDRNEHGEHAQRPTKTVSE